MLQFLQANGSEDVEFITVVDVLRRAGVNVTTASVHNVNEVVLAHGTKVVADVRIEEVATKTYALIVVPGGLPGSVSSVVHVNTPFLTKYLRLFLLYIPEIVSTCAKCHANMLDTVSY